MELAQDESTTEEVQVKRMQGRHVGVNNKKGKVMKKPGLQPLRFTYPVAPSSILCPTNKGKDKKNLSLVPFGSLILMMYIVWEANL